MMFKGSFEQVVNNEEISTSGTCSEYGTELSISESGKYCNARCRSFSGKIGGSYAFSFCWSKNEIPSPYLMKI